MKPQWKKLRSLALAVLLCQTMAQGSETKKWQLGDYTVTTNQSGTFGEKGYQYALVVEYREKEVFSKMAESPLRSFVLLPESLRGEGGEGRLCYRELLDGLDPVRVSEVRLKDGRVIEGWIKINREEDIPRIMETRFPGDWDEADKKALVEAAKEAYPEAFPEVRSARPKEEKTPGKKDKPHSIEW